MAENVLSALASSVSLAFADHLVDVVVHEVTLNSETESLSFLKAQRRARQSDRLTGVLPQSPRREHRDRVLSAQQTFSDESHRVTL